MTAPLTLGAGAGYAGDRIGPAEQLAANDNLDYLVFECLAERTIANAQLRKLNDASAGYSPLLSERMRAVLPACVENDIRIVSNMGAANPTAARETTAEIAADLGLSTLTVASVTGSDVTAQLDTLEGETFGGEPTERYEDICVSANAYMGVDGIIEALADGADVVLTGRVADPSLFLAPIFHEYKWEHDAEANPTQIGQGIACAHLMECAGQVTGGYFADPGYKDVDGLADLGFPIAEVTSDGEVAITKLPETGGEVTVDTCREQILYEVHDPSAYLTPDAAADFSQIAFEQVDPDRVEVTGAQANEKPETLKVNIGYEDAILGEGQISYGGPGAEQRARLAGDIVTERLDMAAVEINELRVDVIGVDSLHEGRGGDRVDPYEVRLRVAGRCPTRSDAEQIGREVQTLYTNGPAGGGGATMHTKPLLGIVSTLIDRDRVDPTVTEEEVS